MTVVGIAMVKDEADIIESTVRHMLTQVDSVLIRDNNSQDGTFELLEMLGHEYGERFTLWPDPEPAYYQSEKMSVLAAAAASQGAAWVVPFDADEIWYSPFGTIRGILTEDTNGASIATAKLYDHTPTAVDPPGDDPIQTIGWRRREPAGLRKVAVKPSPAVTIHQGNHGADFGGTADNLLVVRHFPYRSVDQFVSKVRNGAAAYAATDLPEDEGKHWRDYGRILESEGPDGIAGIFRSWFWYDDPHAESTILFDPAPV